MWKPGGSRCKEVFSRFRRKDGRMRECEEKCAGPQSVFAEKVFESGNCAESRRGDPVLFFVFFDYLRVAWGDGIFQNDFPDRVGSDPAGRGIFH